MTMNLPDDLQIALEQVLQTTTARNLTRTANDLSQRYRTGHAQDQHTFLHTQEDIAAYAAYRLPATFAAIYAALTEVRTRRPDWQPRTLLDVGAGPGTAMWAVTTQWPTLEHVTLLERDQHMLHLGQKLAQHAHSQAVKQARWRSVDLTGQWEETQYDLVICSYVLGELPQAKREAISEHLWACTGDTLLFVEPGTPRGFELIRTVRTQLLAKGTTTIAPCPHDNACPIQENDWCHFAQRINRTRLHRSAKGATLAYEDEKFSYVALSRTPGLPIAGRVIRHPQKRGGHIHMELCTPEGLRTTTISRSAGQAYHKAQDLHWGAAIEEIDV
jgi:ribosomal protein RSM22 (predicted rRNA methylase)